jgi:serine/threonine protein kinase
MRRGCALACLHCGPRFAACPRSAHGFTQDQLDAARVVQCALMAWPPHIRMRGYEIVGPLGAGGMGEVYRARDIRLQRDVALKVLPSLLVADPERLARFEREARVLASLNHPHIAAIYGIVDVEGERERTPVLVLELVEGETLQDRLARGPLAVDDALIIALRIAEALEAAHEKGIVHRDLKPANVKITPDGGVKVLDFGLAKALDDGHSGVSADPAVSPTVTSPATALGTIMGTAAYMAPEQARGQPVDRRADIWAFGVVLYEMLSRTPAFPGETISDTLAAVLRTDPDWARLRADTPPAVRRLLARCLERDPRQRLQAIGEARIVLAAPHDQIVDAPARRSASRALATGSFAAVLVLGAIAAASLWPGPSSPRADALRKLDVALDGLETGSNIAPALSPDGERIVYRAGGQLWLRTLSEFIPKSLPGTSDAAYPFWSPDSRHIAFVRNDRIWRVGIDGAEAMPVGATPSDLAGTGGGVWTTGGDLVLAGSDRVGLFAVRLTDGTGREILPLDRSQESDFHDVSELPDGRGVLFTVHRGQGADTIAILADGQRRTVIQIIGESLRSPIYSPTGHLLYAREALNPGVWAVRFSLSRLATEGDPVLVVPGGEMPTVGSDGTLAVLRSSDRPSQLVSIDRRGSVVTIGELPGRATRPPNLFSTLAASPDRQRIAVVLKGAGGDDVFSYDYVRRITTRMTVGAATALNPTWSSDGRVFFGSFGGSTAGNVYAVPSHEPSAPERVLPPATIWRWPCTVSPNGRLLVYAEGMDDSTDLWVASLDGTAAPRRLTNTPSFREVDAKFSPDGRWIAYTANPLGRPEIHLRAFPDDPNARQVSREGGTKPAWSADGQEIFYRTDRAMFSVKLAKTPSGVELSAPQQLFSISDPQILNSYAISPDGQRFVFIRSAGSDRVSVILNWAAHLREAARSR